MAPPAYGAARRAQMREGTAESSHEMSQRRVLPRDASARRRRGRRYGGQAMSPRATHFTAVQSCVCRACERWCAKMLRAWQWQRCANAVQPKPA